jgi:hypothetical protein
VPANALNEELYQISNSVLQLRWPWKGNTLTKALKSHASVLESEFIVETGIRLHRGNGIRIRLKTQEAAQSEREETRVL